ncbi:hypothetical protein ACFQ1I_33570 [Kitasatospora arboriphila]
MTALRDGVPRAAVHHRFDGGLISRTPVADFLMVTGELVDPACHARALDELDRLDPWPVAAAPGVVNRGRRGDRPARPDVHGPARTPGHRPRRCHPRRRARPGARPARAERGRKTTLSRILTTLLLPTSGTARVASHDVVRGPARCAAGSAWCSAGTAACTAG